LDILIASQSDAATVAVGFNPRIRVEIGMRRGATLEYGASSDARKRRGDTGPIRRRDATLFHFLALSVGFIKSLRD